MSRRTHDAYERWASTYDSDPNPHTTLEYEAVLSAIAPHEADEILDAACGTGRYTRELVAAGALVVGMDFSKAMLDVARRKLTDVELVHANLESPFPFADQRFNKVLCAQALKHVADLGPAIAEFARVLEPGGLLIFSVTHPDMDWTDYELAFEPGFLLGEASDIFHHREEDYLSALERAGFSAIDVVTVPVSKIISHLLTRRSFDVVRGRPQIAVFRAQRA